jgi:hypothetical protein
MDFNETFAEFKKMRTKIKKPITEFAERLIKEKLSKLSPDEEIQIKILEQSIMNSWQGVFPLRDYVVSSQFSKEVEQKARDYHSNTGRIATEDLKQKWETKLKNGQGLY